MNQKQEISLQQKIENVRMKARSFKMKMMPQNYTGNRKSKIKQIDNNEQENIFGRNIQIIDSQEQFPFTDNSIMSEINSPVQNEFLQQSFLRQTMKTQQIRKRQTAKLHMGNSPQSLDFSFELNEHLLQASIDVQKNKNMQNLIIQQYQHRIDDFKQSKRITNYTGSPIDSVFLSSIEQNSIAFQNVNRSVQVKKQYQERLSTLQKESLEVQKQKFLQNFIIQKENAQIKVQNTEDSQQEDDSSISIHDFEVQDPLDKQNDVKIKVKKELENTIINQNMKQLQKNALIQKYETKMQEVGKQTKKPDTINQNQFPSNKLFHKLLAKKQTDQLNLQSFQLSGAIKYYMRIKYKDQLKRKQEYLRNFAKTFLEVRKELISSQIISDELLQFLNKVKEIVERGKIDIHAQIIMQQLQKFEHDSSEINRQYMQSFRKIQQSFLPYYVSQANIERLADKIKSLNYQYNNADIEQFQQQTLKDTKIQNQLKNIQPETKELLNHFFKNQKQEKYNKNVTYNLQSLDDHFNEQNNYQQSIYRNKKTEKILNLLKQQFKRWVQYQLNINQNRRQKIFYAQYYVNENKQKVNCEGIKKLRKIFEQKILKKDLNKFKIEKINQNLLFQLYSFKIAMHIIFDQLSCKNIERKYAHIGLNQFKNDYLREVAFQAVHLREFLRVYSLGYELKLPNIIINQQNLDFVSGVVQQNLGAALQKKVNQGKFYQILKQQNLKDQDRDDLMKVAIFNFYNASGGVKYQKIHNSGLLNLQDNIFFVNSLKITHQQSKGLNKFLKSFDQVSELHVRQIIIDQCLLDDEILQNILDGLTEQHNKFELFGQIRKIQSLQTFIANKITFGQKSLEKLLYYIPDLIELKLNGLIMEQETFVPYLDQIFQKYIYYGKYLMKLTISNMNLNNATLMTSLTQVLREKRELQYLDFNNTNLNPELLQILSNEMENQCMQYRDINLSYNELDFRDEQSQQFKTSYVVLQNLRHILEHNVILNHLNLSGMKFRKNQMLEIFNSCIRSPLLMTLHLNDNGINVDHSMFQDALGIFKIDPNDLPPQRKILFPDSTFFRESIQPNADFKLEQRVQKFFRYQKNNQSQYDRKNEVENLKILKENIIIGKELKDIERWKSINQCKFSNGIGRIQDSQQDPFTLTRILNHPELIFNQNLNNDSKPNLRFFQKDHQSKWKLSVRSECFICDRNQYLMIFYQRGVLANNQDLTEIFDKDILQFLKYEYKKNFTIYKSDTPLICGTLVNKNSFQNLFDRKLKMLRTPIFSMLSIIQAKDFANRNILINKVKEGIQNYLQHDKIEYLEQIEIKNCMNGWEQIINDMALNNELYDLKVINLPNLIDPKINSQDWFTFAGFYDAGYHQILIYDPLLNRAFCKDFVLYLNKRDFVYPEYPTPQGSIVQKNVPNMWSKWLEDTEEDLDKIYMQDVFQNIDMIDKFIRNKDDTKQCLYIIRDYLARILTYQKELFVKSKSYPQIDWEAVNNFVEQTQNSEDFELQKIQRAQVELQFIQSNRKPGQAILGGTLKRCDLIEFLLRMAKTYVTDNISARENVSKHLSVFLRSYIGEIAEGSSYHNHRRTIRKSSKLNELLFDNNQGLSQIFDDLKKTQGKGLFDLKTARTFFERFNKQGMLKLKPFDIDECFIFSMMTIHNEKQHLRKYDYLVFVEFQELLCRLAYIGFEEQDPIEYKVFWLLQLIWKDRYKHGIWIEEKMPLKQINNEIL